MKKITMFSLLVFSMTTYGQTAKPFPKSFGMASSKCQSIVVNMISGGLASDKGDDFVLICDKKKGFTVKCDFIDGKNKVYATREMTAAIVGNDAIVKTENDSDVFILSLMTKKFYSTANIYVEDGAIRGSKNCAGEFSYLDETKNGKKK